MATTVILFAVLMAAGVLLVFVAALIYGLLAVR